MRRGLPLARPLLQHVPYRTHASASARSLYRRSALEPIMEAMVSKGYAFQMEIIVRARASGLWVAEVPIVFVDRLFGQSKLGAGEIAQYLSGMLRLLFTL